MAARRTKRLPRSARRAALFHGAKGCCYKRRLLLELLEDRRMLALDHSGPITANEHWSASEVHRIVDTVTVVPGTTLTIEPGAIVQFDPGDRSLNVQGALVADGTPESPILFTSVFDDTGHDGVLGTGDDVDTGGDGPTQGAKGFWTTIAFSPGSTGNLLNHVEVRYGGTSGFAEIDIQDAGVTLTSSTIRDGAADGVRIVRADPAITNVRIQDNSGAAIRMDPDSHPAIRNVTLTGNDINGVAVDGGRMERDNAWDNPGVVYFVSDSVTVAPGVTLTVAPGQIVKIAGARDLVVDGTLAAAGTEAQPVVFTSGGDDATGGETVRDRFGNEGLRGSWGALRFTASSTANTLRHAEVRHGGNTATQPDANIYVDGGPLTMRDCLVSDIFYGASGLRIEESNPTIRNTIFRDIRGPAMRMDLASSPAFDGITLIDNWYNAVQLDGGALPSDRDMVWDNPEVVYYLDSEVTVPAGRTLTIAPGQIIKWRVQHYANWPTDSRLLVNGTLRVEGTPDAPVIFTGLRDDSAGGDTNNDGPPQPDWESWTWKGIEFSNTSSANVLDHIEMRYAGGGQLGAVRVDGADVTLRNSVLRNLINPAFLACTGATAQLAGNLIAHNDRGVWAQSGAVVTAVNNTIDSFWGGAAVQADGAAVHLTNNLITNTSGYGGYPGVEALNGGAVNAAYNDVFGFSGNSGNYSGMDDQTGLNGNISEDPRYFSPENLQYHLRAGSPAIDSAWGDAAPAADFYGNPRYDDPGRENTGAGQPDYVDRGAIERQEFATSTIDLAASSVTVSDFDPIRQTATVGWLVRNLGVAAARAPWRDAVYLSADEREGLRYDLARAGGAGSETLAHLQGNGERRFLLRLGERVRIECAGRVGS